MIFDIHTRNLVRPIFLALGKVLRKHIEICDEGFNDVIRKLVEVTGGATFRSNCPLLTDQFVPRRKLVELSRIELLTSCVQSRRSPS